MAVVVACVLAGVAAGSAQAALEYVIAPEVVGNVRLGERLVCSSGTWKGRPEFKYEWVREGVPIEDNEPAGTYKLQKADEHKEVWCIVTATSGSEEAYADSVNSVCLGGGCHEQKATEPEIEVYPEVTGTPAVGDELTCSPGKWRGTPPPTFTYKWLRDKEAIESAAGSTYTVVPEDETDSLSCRVTATNEAGEVTVESENSLSVPGSPPKNTKLPEVRGVAAVNETLTCYEGAWTGSAPLKFAFQWLLNGEKIAEAIGSTFVVEPADEGQSLSCMVTAENSLGKPKETSPAVTVSGKLDNVEPPTITGTAKEKEILTCSKGAWNEPTAELELSYQWKRENEQHDQEKISGATTKEHEVVSADLGDLLYCQVTAKNSKAEEVEAQSLAFPVSKPGGPKIENPPKVSGTPTLGHTLTCEEGSWTNSPTQYVFQWLRGKTPGKTPSEKTPIAKAESKTYAVTTADEGYSLSCRVIAENSEGPSKPAESEEQYVSGESPNVTSAPEVIAGSSTPRVGESLTCLRGEWNGEPTPTFTYEWLRDGMTKVGVGAAYTIASEDRGQSLSCVVTATNDEAPQGVPAASNSVYIPGSPPEPPLGGPTISGEPTVGETLTCHEGSWTGEPAPTFTFQWLVNGTAIPSATGKTFTVGTADRGSTLACRVTGKSSEGEASSLSKGVHVPGIPPEPIEQPFISGTGAVGRTLTCERGIWNGKPPPSFTYQWYRNGAPIASATEEEYTVQPADQGNLLSCNVTATNIEGSVEAESSNGVAIPSGASPSKVEVAANGPSKVQPLLPTAAEILASLKRQLTTALSRAHMSSIIKAGGFSFSFLAPSAGKLEMHWYQIVKAAHGSKKKQLVVAQSSTSFTAAKKGTIKLKLTTNGRRLLKSVKRKQHITLTVKAIFTIAHDKPVTWSGKLVLSG